MGNLHADAYAEMVKDGQLGLRTAISANLTSNHYPPLPTEYVDPIIEALDAYNEDDPNRKIYLPVSLPLIPRQAVREDDGGFSIDATTLILITHSDGFLNADDEEGEW